MVAYSLMFGAVISSGIMWPLIAQREGQWYESGLQSQDFRGLFGYKVCLKHVIRDLVITGNGNVLDSLLHQQLLAPFPCQHLSVARGIDDCVLLQNFIAIAIFIGDGLYNFLKIGILSLQVSMAILCSGHLALASRENHLLLKSRSVTLGLLTTPCAMTSELVSKQATATCGFGMGVKVRGGGGGGEP